MNLIRNHPLSTSDFSSGRFDKLCKYVQENWRYNKVLTFEEAQNIVAVTFGYSSLIEAKNSATDKFPENLFNHENHFWCDPIGNLKGIIFHGAEKSLGSLDGAWAMVKRNEEVAEFYSSWPKHLIGRWQFDAECCNLAEDTLSDLERCFESLWCNNTVRQTTIGTLPGRNTSAATITAIMDKWIDIEKIKNSAIEELIDPEIIEKLFQDATYETIRSILDESRQSVCRVLFGTGFSPEDAKALPKNSSGFPNLYSHMRELLETKILTRKAISLFTHTRSTSGFYIEPHKLEPANLPQKDHYPFGENYFVFNAYSDHCEPSSFRSYSWHGQIQNCSGDILAYAKGSYFTGPAKIESGGGDLISAADSVGDQDIDTLDYVLSELQAEILVEHSEDVDKHDINMQRLFIDGNLITIALFERHSLATPGIGTELISECLTRLKIKYKRNFHIASLVNPLQYRRDSNLVTAVSEQRMKDSFKIINKLNNLHEHPNVIKIYLNIHEYYEGLHTAFRYMQGNAG
jgi:hypothetical protein